jgi:hypothetical protein
MTWQLIRSSPRVRRMCARRVQFCRPSAGANGIQLCEVHLSIERIRDELQRDPTGAMVQAITFGRPTSVRAHSTASAK